MKKILFLGIFFYTLLADNSIPSAINKQLCKQLADLDNGCENGSVIQYDHHYVMDNDNLLLFVHLDPQTVYTGSEPPITKTIVQVDTKGQWHLTQGTNMIREDVETVSQSSDGHLWVRTHWHIEGVYPALYDSPKGLAWQRTSLPENRDVDCCFEAMKEPCLQSKNIILSFENNDGSLIKSWRSDYKSVFDNKPLWQPINNCEIKECLPPSANNHWEIEKNNETITFTHQTTKAKVTLSKVPRFTHQLKSIYYVQIGAFTQIESFNAVRNVLNVLSNDYKFIRKEMTINNQPYTKLLIGEYTTQQKAQTILNKLKRIYTKNRDIQNAFVTSIPIEK